jgi:hypothetical protein
MGIFRKLKFWGKEDDIDFDSLTSQDINQGLTPSDDLGKQPDLANLDKDPLFPAESLSPNQQYQPDLQKIQPSENKDLELISSKLDTIKAMLDSMDRRLSNLERTSGTEKKNNLW